MKHFYIFLFIAAINFSVAQDPRLFENTWYLVNFNDDGTDYAPPHNSSDPNPLLTFNEEEALLQTNMCNYLAGAVSFDSNLNGFVMADHYVTLSFCASPENESFDSRYLGFYLGSLPSYYTYDIYDQNGSDALRITSESGSYAVYSSAPLSVKENDIPDFSISPNPVSDIINISSGSSSFSPERVEIYNSFGSLCISQGLKPGGNSISLAHLARGIYMAKLFFEVMSVTRMLIKL